MWRRPALILLAVALLASTLTCRRNGPTDQPGRAAGVSEKGAVSGKNTLPIPAWTAERVRKFVVDADLAVIRATTSLKRPRDKIVGECYGEPAAEIGPVSEVIPVLERFLTGRALDCYLATYFGCRIGDVLANAGVAKLGPGASPFRQSKVTIVEQSADRVVADVNEADFNDVIDGELTKWEGDKRTEFADNSRYTIVRDDKGTWRISDRKPTFKDWECRPR